MKSYKITNLKTLYQHIRTNNGHLCTIAKNLHLPFGVVLDTNEGLNFFLNKYKGKFNKLRELSRRKAKQNEPI